MTVQLNIRLEKDQKERLVELAKADNKSITSYILDKTLLEKEPEESAQNHANERISDDNTRIDNKLYEALIEQLDRKDEQIVNLQKIIYNKDTKLLELSEKKVWWQFWK